MNSKDYWEKREAEQLKHNLIDEKEYEKRLKQIYEDMLENVQNEINDFYIKYARGENITIQEAKRRISKSDIEKYKNKAERYVKEKNFSKQANEEMRLYNATMKINRLEMLKANIGLELVAGHDELEKFTEEVLNKRTVEELERQAGILGETIHDNAKTANSIVNASFHNATFSNRIWMYQAEMKADLEKLLQQGLIQGKNPRALARELRRKFNVSIKDSERLMRTELARVQTDAQKKSFEENGFEEYTFIVNGGCCEICEGIKDKHFKVKDMQPGLNAPPMHPNCRCSTAAYEDSDDYEAWLDFLANGGTTAEWKALKPLDSVKKLNAEKERYLKENGYDIYGDSLEEMEDGFFEEAADGSMKVEAAYIKSINNKIDILNKPLIKSPNSGKISMSKNAPTVIGGAKCKVSEKQYGFGDGSGGVKKAVTAVIYETQDGTKFVFPKMYNKKHQTMTPEQAIANWQKVPQSIRKQAQKTIEIVDYYNPTDAYWRKRYKNFGHSYATGGDKIIFYRYDAAHSDNYIVRTYCHEAGHYIDRNLATGNGNNARYSSEAIWTKAMADDLAASGRKSCTAYGENAPTEDFAESVAEYIKDKKTFSKDFPNRAALLSKII